MLMRLFAVCAIVVCVSSARADDVKDAEAKLKDYLKDIPGAEAGRVTALADGTAETFPDFVLFSHVIPQFPVAREAPAPLKYANIIAIPKKAGKPVLMTDAKELQKFFQDNARAATKEAEVNKTVEAWLRAVSELQQDGFFKFTVKADRFVSVGDAATGEGTSKVNPQNGDKGEITTTLKFKAGKITTIESKVNVIAGMRPRCHATKLLDPDPIVRAIAEDSLRVMGSSAAGYLQEQYAKASPALREAIDRVRAKSKAEGRW